MRSTIFLLLFWVVQAVIDRFRKKAEGRLSDEERLTVSEAKAIRGVRQWVTLIGAIGLTLTAMNYLPAHCSGTTAFLICFPLLLGTLLFSDRSKMKRMSVARLPADYLIATRRTDMIGTLVMSGILSAVFACLVVEQRDFRQQQAKWKTEQDKELAELAQKKEAEKIAKQLFETRLQKITAKVTEFAGRERHVINEDQLRKNAEKTDAASYARRIYLKLPLHQVAYHWKFKEEAKLLAGNLTLTIKRGAATEISVIFHDGAIAPDWELMDHYDDGANAIYFGFISKKTFLVSELDEVGLKLSIGGDIEGIGADKQGVLKRGEYASFTQFKLYHLEKSTGKKDEYAYLNNDGWNIDWKLDITSNHGWKH